MNLNGSIPACAGEPAVADCDAYAMPVYPRVCGGTVTGRTEKQESEGLSPRVRGNQLMEAVVPE